MQGTYRLRSRDRAKRWGLHRVPMYPCSKWATSAHSSMRSLPVAAVMARCARWARTVAPCSHAIQRERSWQRCRRPDVSELAGATSASTEFSERTRHYVLGVLVVVYTMNFIDRQILSILLEPIKHDLGLSDTQLGLLTGFAFGVFYATLGVPIARLADRSNRRNLIAVALAVWSGMTAFSGLAQNYVQLLLARIGVGVGEAGCSPSAHSMISVYFAGERRATALGIYSLGIPVGILFGFTLGGLISDTFGWRAAFFVVGVPGLLLALLLRFT